MPTPITQRELGRATLARQLLLERSDSSVEAAVAQLCGLQAQEPKPPYIGLWTRLQAFSANQMNSSLHEHSLVRGPAMRATLHTLTADDYLALRSSYSVALSSSLSLLGTRAEGLDQERVVPAAKALLEQQPLDFDEIRDALVRQFPKVDDRALGYTVRMLLPLVMVPSDDAWGFPRKAKFALAEQWLGKSIVPDAGDQLIVRRYLAAFGPATPADFTAWSAIKGAKAMFDQIGDDLVQFKDEAGRTYYDLADAPRPGADVDVPVRLLPEFDNLVLGHADRKRFIGDEFKPHVVTKNLRVRSAFLVDGEAAGLWNIKRTKKLATLTLEPFGKLTKRNIGLLTKEAEVLLAFSEAEIPGHKVVVGDPLGPATK